MVTGITLQSHGHAQMGHGNCTSMENRLMEAVGSLLAQKSLVCFIYIIPDLLPLFWFCRRISYACEEMFLLVFLVCFHIFSIYAGLVFAILVHEDSSLMQHH